jgi:hypothetical protein
MRETFRETFPHALEKCGDLLSRASIAELLEASDQHRGVST